MSYPGSFSSIPNVLSGGLIQSSYTNSQSNAINQIETCLGLNPQGGAATVGDAIAVIPGNVQNEAYVFGADTGSANAYAVSLTPAPSAYAAGMVVVFQAANGNTSASTLNVNGLGTKAIKRNATAALVSGDIVANQLVVAIYDGTNFQLVASAPNNNSSTTVVLSGGYASRPAAATPGRIYVPTDTIVYSEDNGSAWINFGPQFPLHDPTLFTWTSSTVAPATVDTSKGVVRVVDNNATYYTYVYKSLPTAPYTITVALMPYHATTSHVGTGWLDSTSGKFAPFYFRFQAPGFGCDHYTDQISGGSGPFYTTFSPTGAYGTFLPVMWFRLIDDGTTRYGYTSADGISWWLWGSEGNTSFITADSVILFAGSGVSSPSCGASFISYKESAGVITGPDW